MRLLFVFLFSAQLLAQSTTLHLDRPYHAAGEVSWFTAYLPAPAPPKVRVAVYAPGGEAIDYFFLDGKDGASVTGHYRWPYEVATGTYRLNFAGLSVSGELVDLGTFEHPVYNLSDRTAAPATDRSTATTSTGALPGDLRADVRGRQLSLSGLSSGSYTVSIYQQEVTADSVYLPVSAPTETAPAYLDTLFYTGQLIDQAGAPQNVNLLPFFDGTTFRTYFSKAENNGTYLLTVAPFVGSKTMQARSITDEEFRLRPALPALPPVTTQPALTAEVLAYLDLANRRRKIYQLYQTVETKLDTEIPAESRKVLRPNRDFNVQDFKAFPDMFTFFKEVAGELRYRKRKDGYFARLYNAPNQRFFSEAPLFVVNGLLTRNVDYIAGISPANVEYLGFYYDNKALRRDFPALGNHGVVQIDLLRNDPGFPEADAVNTVELKGLQPSIDFLDTRGGNLPKLSPLLMWRSGQVTDGELTLQLPVTDDYGSYRIVISHRGENGQVRTLARNYRVPRA